MTGVNKVILVGRVGNDPETRTAKDVTFTNITLATSENWKDKNTGERQERTEWHRITFRGKLAEIVGEYGKKGMLLYVEGSIRTRSWEQDGEKKYATEIVANEMQMLSSKDNTAEPSGGAQRSSSSSREAPHRAGGSGVGNPPNRKPSRQPPPDDSFDDDIPF
jgi:single-strand DNA-binding protein